MSLFSKETAGQLKAQEKTSFVMKIDDLFFITQVGALVVGDVGSGSCAVGDAVSVLHNGKEIPTKITMIHSFGDHRQENAAFPGERVGLGLFGITKEQLVQKEIGIGDDVVIRLV